MHVRVMRTHGQPTDMSCPMVSGTVPAGFPSPADDYIDGKLDLNSYLIKHPAATYFVRATGDSMIGAGIHSGDILIVDRSLEPCSGCVVIAALDGDLTVKRLRMSGGKAMLMPDNANYRPIVIGEGTRCEIWVIVTAVVHKL